MHAIAAANDLPSDAQDDIARIILRLTSADGNRSCASVGRRARRRWNLEGRRLARRIRHR